MKKEFAEGYYITGFSYGSSREGPLSPRRVTTAAGRMMNILGEVLDASRVGVTVEHGVPVIDKFDAFDPISPGKKIFELERENGPIERHSFGVQKINPDRKYLPKGRKVFFPSSFESNRVFDIKLIQYLLESAAYYKRRDRAYSIAVKRAGLIKNERPKLVDREDPLAVGEFQRLDREFMEKVVAHVTIPRPVAVRIEGLDSLLNDIWR